MNWLSKNSPFNKCTNWDGGGNQIHDGNHWHLKDASCPASYGFCDFFTLCGELCAGVSSCVAYALKEMAPAQDV